MFGLNQLRPALRTAANSTTLLRSFSASARRDFARMTVVGRLGGTPELVATNSGREYVKYVVASSSGPRDNPITSWFRISSFQPDGSSRQHLLSLPKGSLVLVEGDATLRSFDNSHGTKTTALNISQKTIRVLKRGQAGEQSGESGESESHGGESQ